MADVKITHRDIGVTIAILLIAFVGIPLFAWWYSGWRINEAAKKNHP